MIRDIARFVALGSIFALPFLPLIVIDSLFFPFITGKNFLFRIIVEVGFAAWVILAFYDPKYRPRFSYILVGILSLLGIMFLANAFGVSPHKSFWSNFERMDGYITLVHMGMYFVLASSMLAREKMWNAFLNTSLFVATLMMLYGFCQLSGSTSCPISQSDVRIDGRMGNAAYLAIYMLFHIFFALIMLVRSSGRGMQIAYGLLAFGFVYTLAQTGTRGTTLALFGGAFLSAAYIAIFERENRIMRKVAIAGIALVVVVAGALYSAKDSEFIQSNTIMKRLASVSLEEGQTRFTIWKLALEGVKERPLLGWGQENFNYVFNKHYSASLYGQEPWFDRVHNIVFDWLVAGGILGFLAYVSVIGSALYYVVVRPLVRREGGPFSVAERGLLFGLLGGYIAHNLLVFDNLISYFFFFSILALIHAESARDIKPVETFKIQRSHVDNIVAPTVAVALLVALYMVNLPGYQAAGDLIDAFRAKAHDERLAILDTALGRKSFADQEIREQMGRLTQQALQDQAIAEETKMQYAVLTEEEFKKQMEETPDDVRIMVFQSAFFRSIGKVDDAIAISARALLISPQKQQLYYELGFAYAQKGEAELALATFKQAYELETRNATARMFYAGSALSSGDRALFDELVLDTNEEAYVDNDSILRIAYDKKMYDIVIDILTKRIEKSPQEIQLRTTLALAYHQSGQTAKAIAVIEKAIVDFPDFKVQGNKYIQEIKQGGPPVSVVTPQGVKIKY